MNPKAISADYLTAKELWKGDTVIDFQGQPIPKENAIRIEGRFYEKNKTATFVDDSWYRNSDLIRDSYDGEMKVKCLLTKGIINTKKEIGHFSKDTPFVRIKDKMESGDYQEAIVMTGELATKLGYTECMNSGGFFKGISPYHDHKASPEFFDHSQKLKKIPNVHPANIPHNTRYGIASHTFIKSEGKEYTFGVEMETASGVLKGHVYKGKLNLSCCRDGSISGGEYVTGVLTGDQGLIQLRKICVEIAKRCTIDERCGVHLHVGGFIPNKEFTIYAFILGHMVQDDLFGMLPSSRRTGEYSQPFDPESSTIRDVTKEMKLASSSNKTDYEYHVYMAYEAIFKWLSKGVEPSDNCNKGLPHPQGRYCGGHSSARYKWLNLVCTNFSRMRFDDAHQRVGLFTEKKKPSGFTIEFRNHSATLSYKKIENWVLIGFAFVWFVENRKRELMKAVVEGTRISLSAVIQEAYPKSHPALLAYINERTKLFSGGSKEVRDFAVDKTEEKKTLTFLKENFK